MRHKPALCIRVVVILMWVAAAAHAQPACDKVCGKWESTDKNLIVEVYKFNGDFKAKILWFDDGSEQQMRACADNNNPDKALRTRKVLGMDVLTGLVYQPATGTWENGMVYDAKHGREWNASAYIGKHGQLRVRGYWHFKFIGRTMAFYRV